MEFSDPKKMVELEEARREDTVTYSDTYQYKGT